MKKTLINSESEYENLMRSEKYWSNETFNYIGDWRTSLPEKYPCVVIHESTWNHRTGRESWNSEFIYTTDFELRQCTNGGCNAFILDREAIWCDAIDDYTCGKCAERLD